MNWVRFGSIGFLLLPQFKLLVFGGSYLRDDRSFRDDIMFGRVSPYDMGYDVRYGGKHPQPDESAGHVCFEGNPSRIDLPR